MHMQWNPAVIILLYSECDTVDFNLAVYELNASLVKFPSRFSQRPFDSPPL